MLPRKPVEKYTPSDIIQIWKVEFQKANRRPYSSSGSVFDEMKMARELLERYGIYHVLLSIPIAIKEDFLSFQEFYEHYETFVQNTQYAKLAYFIQKNGDASVKEKWRRLLSFESAWLQTPGVKKERLELEKDLNEWLVLVKS